MDDELRKPVHVEVIRYGVVSKLNYSSIQILGWSTNTVQLFTNLPQISILLTRTEQNDNGSNAKSIITVINIIFNKNNSNTFPINNNIAIMAKMKTAFNLPY